MRKIKELWLRIINASVLWFVIPVFVIVIIPTLWYTRPLLNLNADDITIYKFAITVLGVTVGIGTVVNSTRSAKTAAESMRVTKEKELREQSSHPIILSLIKTFPYNAPMYQGNVIYDFPTKTDKERLPKNLNKHLDSIGDFILEQQDQHNRAFINRTNTQLIKQNEIKNYLEVINTGKGSCVNLKYEFKFINQKEFDGYSVSYEGAKVNKHITMPSYSLSVVEYEKIFEIIIIDNFMSDFVDDANITEPLKSTLTEGKLKFSKESTFRNFSSLEPDKKLTLPLPNEFIVLSKHYAIVEILKKKVENNDVFNSLLPSINPLLNSNPIKPIGVITLSFYDESLIRTGDYSSDEKTKITYNVSINENAIISNNTEFDMYLEANLIKTETQSKTQKKRAYN